MDLDQTLREDNPSNGGQHGPNHSGSNVSRKAQLQVSAVGAHVLGYGQSHLLPHSPSGPSGYQRAATHVVASVLRCALLSCGAGFLWRCNDEDS